MDSLADGRQLGKDHLHLLQLNSIAYTNACLEKVYRVKTWFGASVKESLNRISWRGIFDDNNGDSPLW